MSEETLDQLRTERDAYRKAKAENDERFMIERDQARGERDDALRACAQVRALTVAACDGWDAAKASHGMDVCGREYPPDVRSEAIRKVIHDSADTRQQPRPGDRITVYDHAVNCAWQDGSSDCDCNREAVSVHAVACAGLDGISDCDCTSRAACASVAGTNQKALL